MSVRPSMNNSTTTVKIYIVNSRLEKVHPANVSYVYDLVGTWSYPHGDTKSSVREVVKF